MNECSHHLDLVPVTLAEANAYVESKHRHHPPVVGHKFSLGAYIDDMIVGVVIVGRPVARHLDNGFTLEVTRLCTDGSKNACSFLYGAAWRACKALGYRKLVTYTLQSEGGASLRAAGWKCLGERRGRGWSCPSRPRVDKHSLENKFAWQAGIESVRE
jgi:hypothetical protein